MTVKAVLMTPGSGGSTDHPTLHQLVDELDVPVVLYDFAYRRAGKRSPGRTVSDRLIGELGEAAASVAEELGIQPQELVLGGRSMGGRVCSMAVADGLACAGLALLSYPLHPPGKPEKLRVDHWPEIAVPCLFVSGRNDPFGSPDEFAQHLGFLGGSASSRWLSSGSHDPRNRVQRDEIVAAVREWIRHLG